MQNIKKVCLEILYYPYNAHKWGSKTRQGVGAFVKRVDYLARPEDGHVQVK